MLSIAFFIPFLVIAFYQKPLKNCLWIALGCGLMLDLLQAGTRFGIFSLNYVLCTVLVYSKKHHFFGDRVSTLPLMTLLFSFISASLQLSLLCLFQPGFGLSMTLSWGLLGYQLGIQPIEDILYSFLVFVLPLWLFSKPQRSAREYFLS